MAARPRRRDPADTENGQAIRFIAKGVRGERMNHLFAPKAYYQAAL